MKKFIQRICLFTCLLFVVSFKPLSDFSSRRSWTFIQFENYVDIERLMLDTMAYRNEAGQLYSVTKFKYYISDICLKIPVGYEYATSGSFLLDQDDEISRLVIFKEIPYGAYSSMSFTIGIDSIHNCSGAQSGALDPVNGMFWAWNTGYVFLKLEGKSEASKTSGHNFEFHIGGYKAPVNCLRRVTLNFPDGGLLINAAKDAHFTIKAEISEILKSPTIVDFSKVSSVTDFHNAKMIADNYADMFSIAEINYLTQ